MRLDQYDTEPAFAKHCYQIVCDHYDPADFLMVEPSAGSGVFLELLPCGSLAYDVAPRHPLVEKADFLDIQIDSDQPIMVVGNPPFGRCSRMAIRFFNHAARFATVIALILPRTVRKARTQNLLESAFHLVREELAPRNAFSFRGRPHDVPAVFQVWERRKVARTLRTVETTHPAFEFVEPRLVDVGSLEPLQADFVIRRIGARAGHLHHDLTVSRSSHYFIRGDVEAVMRQLDFASVAQDVTGIPSLSKSEIVALFRAFEESQN